MGITVLSKGRHQWATTHGSEHYAALRETHCRRSTYFEKTYKQKVEKGNNFALSYIAQLTDLTTVAPHVPQQGQMQNLDFSVLHTRPSDFQCISVAGPFLPANYLSWVFWHAITKNSLLFRKIKTPAGKSISTRIFNLHRQWKGRQVLKQSFSDWVWEEGALINHIYLKASEDK